MARLSTILPTNRTHFLRVFNMQLHRRAASTPTTIAPSTISTVSQPMIGSWALSQRDLLSVHKR
jgi:hypothetical protein